MSQALATNPVPLGDQRATLREDPQSPVTLVCSACQAGPFSYEGFRQAVAGAHYSGTTGYRYVTTWNAISRSIDNEACRWCHIVRRTRDALPTERFPSSGEESVEVRFQVSTGKYPMNKVQIYLNGFEAATYDIYANPGDRTAQAIGENGPQEYCVDYPRVLEYIQQCENHEHCPTIEDACLPTRVIDCSDPSKPHLVETQRKIRGHYCTLSYVWGGEQHQKTTTSNIDSYVRTGINVPLPPTIADAISVTNKLGIRYLWVDALCIIQDSSEDKQRELEAMAGIYRHAYLTIAARSALRADQGFLPHERAPDVLPFHLADSSMPPVRMLLWYRIPWKDPITQPLDRRGWCLQEGLLSPRRLIFDPSRVAYKCLSFHGRDLSRNFSDRSAVPANDYILFQTPTNENHDSTTCTPIGRVDDKALWERWRRVLCDYSKRKITIPSDKFVALASIIEAFQSISNDQYVAGLWRRSLPRGLLWEVRYAGHRPLSYRAPSWSWASVDGEVIPYSSHFDSTATYEAEILACDVTPKISILPFGEITNARLTMKAKIYLLSRDGREVGETRFDCLEGSDHQLDFYLIILCANIQPGYQKYRNDWMQGLIVLSVDGNTEQYRRVGKWRSRDQSFDTQSPDWFDNVPLKTITLI